MVSSVNVSSNGNSRSPGDLHKMKGFTPAVIYIVALCLNMTILSSSRRGDHYTSNHTVQIILQNASMEIGQDTAFKGYYYYDVADKLREKDWVDDDFFKWLNPTDDYLAAESTPIYLIQGRDSSKSDIKLHKLGKYLDDIYSSSDEATVDSFIENTKKQRGRGHNIINTSVNKTAIYPEILVVVDDSLFNSFGKNILKTLTYILAFWNSVDMRFRTIENPTVRLNIAGIVIAEDNSALSYLNNFVSVNAHFAIDNMGSFFQKFDSIIPLNSYDMIVQLTSRKLYNIDVNGKYADVSGYAHIGVSCNNSQYFVNKYKSSIVYDQGEFGGISSATHELGHLLGMYHDSEGNNSRCFESDYIMAAGIKHFTQNNSKWTSCSLKNLQDFLRDNDVSCLYNKRQNQGRRAKRFFPGKLMDINLQCEKRLKMQANPEHNSCESLQCSTQQSSSESTTIITALVSDDGRSCGDGKICLLNQCI